MTEPLLEQAQLPEQVQTTLQVALQKIGLALAEANDELVRQGYQDFQTLAGTLYYNNPEVHCEVPYLNILLAPLDPTTQEEKEFKEDIEASKVAVFSGRQREVVRVQVLKETNLINSSNAALGTCCSAGKAWKAIYWPGVGRVTLCLSDSNC